MPYTKHMQTAIRIMADGLMVPIVILALYSFAWLIPRSRWWYWGSRIVAAGITSYVAARIAGYFFQPETMRPFEKMGVDPGAAYLNNPGFPSDHALFAMFLTLAVWFSVRHRWIAGTMLVLTLLVCIGRVLALVHTPVDVIGGLLIACVGIVWYRRKPKKVVQ